MVGRRRHQPVHGGDVDDAAAAALDHQRRHLLGEDEHRGEVHVDHPTEQGGVLVQCGQGPVADAGVVDEHVDTTVSRRDCGGDQPRQVGVVGHVAGHGHEALELGGEGLEPVGPAGPADHRGARRVQHTGEALAQPTRGAGDDRHLAVEPEGSVDLDVGGIHGGEE